MTTANSPTDHLIAKLRRRDVLSAAEVDYLKGVLGPPTHVTAGSELVRAGDRPGFSILLIQGYCGRMVTGPAGERQFTQICLAGDFLDLHSFMMKQMDHGVVALTDCVVSHALHPRLVRLTEEQPHLARLLWLETVIDGAIHRQWLYGLGRLDAVGRAAHLICELALRAEAAGLGDKVNVPMPFTQQELADIMGITAVHANRSLMVLRRSGLIDPKPRQVIIKDWDGLAERAQFDLAYLRLHREPV